MVWKWKEIGEETRAKIANIVGKPKYKHDCDACIFLGNYADRDLYICFRDSVDGYTVISRWSSEGANYSSGAVFGKISLHEGGRRLRIAHLIAEDFGLFDE